MIKVQNWIIFVIYIYKPKIIVKRVRFIPPIMFTPFVYHINKVQTNNSLYEEQKNMF